MGGAVVANVVVGVADDAHRLIELRLGDLVVVLRRDELDPVVCQVRELGGERDLRLRAGRDEALHLHDVLLFVPHRLVGDAHERVVRARGEERFAGREQDLQLGRAFRRAERVHARFADRSLSGVWLKSQISWVPVALAEKMLCAVAPRPPVVDDAPPFVFWVTAVATE